MRLKLFFVTNMLVLTAFTAAVGPSIFEQQGAQAYAQSISTDQQVKNAKNLVIVEADDNNKNAASKFIKKVSLREHKQKLCSLSTDQLNKLQQTYEVSIETVTVNGKEVQLARFSGDKLSQGELKKALQADSEWSMGCSSVKYDDAFYFLLNPSVS